MPLFRSIVPLVLLALAGCNARTPEPVTAAAIPAAAPAPILAEADLPKGGGCTAAIGRTQRILASDVATGNLEAPVGQRFNADLDGAERACTAGREAEALRLLAATKRRYGYR